MRRKEMEIIDFKEIESIIERAQVCRLGLSVNNIPYIVPLNFGYKDKCLYFHSAKEGKKIDMIKANQNVCFEMDIDNILIKSKNLSNWTMKYLSVMGTGKAHIINDVILKKEALDTIMEHYAGKRKFEYDNKAFNDVAVIKVDIREISGKKSKY